MLTEVAIRLTTLLLGVRPVQFLKAVLFLSGTELISIGRMREIFTIFLADASFHKPFNEF